MPFLLMYPYTHDSISTVTWGWDKPAAGPRQDTYVISQGVHAWARASLIACYRIQIRIGRFRESLQTRDIGRQEIL